MRTESIKEFNDLIIEINNCSIKIKDSYKDKIDVDCVRKMMLDIVYMIYFHSFKDDFTMDMQSICQVSGFFKTYLVQKTDLWHAIFLLNKLNTYNQLPDKYEVNHISLYYKLGGAERDFNKLYAVLDCVESNAFSLQK